MLSNLLENVITEDEYIRQNNIRIVYKRLPKKIYGCIHKYRNINLITINWNISKEKKKNTLLHEFAHFELHHLEKDFFEFKIQDIEDEADRYIQFILESINKQ